MSKLNGLPVFKMKPGQGIDFTSFVTDPAIEVLYKTFSNKEQYKFNKEKQIVTGPFMIPDLPIYRVDKTHGEYYVVFDKQTVFDLNLQFMSEQKTLSFNYQHQNDSQIDGAVLLETWIVAEGDNKAKNLGFDVPVGTWMGSVKINNKVFWDNEIKTGNVKGFSIEGYLDMEVLAQKLNKNKFMDAKTNDGVTLRTPDDQFISGSMVTVVAADGSETPAKGNYTLENGTVITCDDTGKITNMVEASTEDMTDEEVSAMKKVFGKVFASELKELNDKIVALETKLASLPGADSKTKEGNEGKEKPLSSHQIIMNKVNELKKLNKK